MSSSLALTNKFLLSVGIGIGVTLATGFGYWYYKVWKKNQIPKKWRRIGTLAELYTYPIKSCAAIKLEPENEARCELLGLHWQDIYDRSLALLDEHDGIVTGRTYPKMILIKSEIVAPAVLRLSAENIDPINVNFNELSKDKPNKSNIVRTSMYGSDLDVVLCGQIYDKWFSQVILGKEKGLRLTRFHHAVPVRDIFKAMKHEPFVTRKDTGTLGDCTSYMMMNLSSVADLNKRLKNADVDVVNPLQFRGNFHLKMDHDVPYAEDNWSWIKIGEEAIFRIVGPCVRCIMPNINPVTGQRHVEAEPLKTLKTYRKAENYTSPPLGSLMGLRRFGVVKVDDVIYVSDDE